MTLKTMPKIGDKVRCIRQYYDTSPGNIYEITRQGVPGEVFYIDDVGDEMDIQECYLDNFEIVTEASPQTTGFVHVSSFRIDSTGEHDVNLVTDAAGFAAIQRLVDESVAQQKLQDERHAIEQQIAQLQRKLEALK